MTETISRRTALVAAMAAAATLPRTGHAQAPALKVGTWGGSWRDSLDKLVAARAGVGAVDYVVDTPQGNLAKLVAARGRNAPFDSMESGLELVQLMSADRFVAELDFDRIPNARLLPDYARARTYAMTVGSMDGLVYNADKFKELGLPAPERISDLAHPKLAGRVAFPDITHTQHWNAVSALAYEAGGTEADLAGAIPAINRIKPAYFYSASTDIATRMASGEIWAAPWHAGFVVRLRRTGVPLAITYQSFGDRRGALWPVIHHVVRGAQNPAAAERFIDAYLDPEVQLQHARATGTLPMNRAALTKLGEDPENKAVLLLEPAQLDKLFVVDFTKVALPAWREAWSRDIKRG